jgi:hypothetical protein
MRLVLALFLTVADVGERVEAFISGRWARSTRDTMPAEPGGSRPVPKMATGLLSAPTATAGVGGAGRICPGRR